jgi:hypothetical protein
VLEHLVEEGAMGFVDEGARGFRDSADGWPMIGCATMRLDFSCHLRAVILRV